MAQRMSWEPRMAAGVAAAPLFVVVWFGQAMTRAGFDPVRHPVSLLSLGALGWIQIAGFVVTGALVMVFATGLRDALGSGSGRRAGPILVFLMGVGLVVAGVFPADAGAGFPPGAPEGAPSPSWHGVLHEIGFVLAQFAWPATCVVFTRRFFASGQRRRGAACLVTSIVAVLVAAIPHADSLGLRLVLASAVELGFLGALAVHHAGVGGRVPGRTAAGSPAAA
ncbi:DUF998 domain-containing protein [Nocardia farcinica]|uniref:DUF998 domain-containing protein n=1 Tax=Nocardia farcinica TaxID=37329 RepID=UPI0018951E1A|nr:DUF998 domain-containing protein [Nocardia farcinica]MBF6441830.1 DUF998 domain-containing protein [Nocardia farcinica]